MMIPVAVPDLPADEIDWSLRPLPEPAPMTLEDQLVEAVVDAAAYRELAVVAIERTRELTLALDRAQATIADLRKRPRA
jgi:hypothetical protein